MLRQWLNVWAWKLLEVLYSRGATTPWETGFRPLGKPGSSKPGSFTIPSLARDDLQQVHLLTGVEAHLCLSGRSF